MKKNPASIPATPKSSASKSGRTSKTDAASHAAQPTTSSTDSAGSLLRKPLLNAAVNAARQIFKRKKATKPTVVRKAEKQAPHDSSKTPAARRSVSQTKKKEPVLEVPPILLESDTPPSPPSGGPGAKYSLGATAPAQQFTGGELPESYGTKKLFLTARDPHWLYAHWDLTREQQDELNAQSTDGHLILRVFVGKIQGHPAHEIHVHPESRHWFAHVDQAGKSYIAELGYYSALGKWMRVAVSSGTVTPPDAATKEDTAEFATIPFEFPFARLMQIIEDAVRDNIPLAQAIEELRRTGHPDLPRFNQQFAEHPVTSTFHARPTRPWTPEQEKALEKIINIDETRRVWMGSLEITELIRRRLAHEVTSPVRPFGETETPLASRPTSLSSPFGGGEAGSKGFWFNVNAELVIYGATEPNAKVTLGGHEVRLRADGTFSFRFALPDGQYDLPAVAVSADGTDGRAAELRFSRQTTYLGDVGTTAQDPALRPPTRENL